MQTESGSDGPSAAKSPEQVERSPRPRRRDLLDAVCPGPRQRAAHRAPPPRTRRRAARRSSGELSAARSAGGPAARTGGLANGSAAPGSTGVAGLVAGEQVEQRGGLGDGARQHAVDHQEALARDRGRRRPDRAPPSARPGRSRPPGSAIEPPPSLPCAIGTIPAATAAAEPPLEPPGVRSSIPRVARGPKRRGSVVGRIPHLRQRRLADDHEPRRAKPRDRTLVIGTHDVAHRSLHSVIGMPATGRLSLIAIGTPANGRGSPAATRLGRSQRAFVRDVVKALIRGSSSSIRSQRALDQSRAAARRRGPAPPAPSPSRNIRAVDHGATA